MPTVNQERLKSIFLSYAREQEQAAEEINAALAVRDFNVFFDRYSLEGGKEYHVSIDEAIKNCDLFMFLISPDSVALGSFALSELTVAKDTFPNPSGRVLPVMVEPTVISRVDAYLRVVTILYPQGNLAAEVASRVAGLLSRPESGSEGDQYKENLRTERIAAYRPLWQLTGLLPKWPRSSDVTYEGFKELSGSFRDWYFTDGGGMLLSRNSMTAYAAVQDTLTAMARQNPTGPISDEDYGAVRDLLSSLRSALTQDIGARM